MLVDGEPVRSCITFAAACEGARITTLEGLVDDPLLADLRTAFTEHHALQCGYCTPGMLMSCRDIILRLPDGRRAPHPHRTLRQSLSLHGLRRNRRRKPKPFSKRGDVPGCAARPNRRLGPTGAHALAAQPPQEFSLCASPIPPPGRFNRRDRRRHNGALSKRKASPCISRLPCRTIVRASGTSLPISDRLRRACRGARLTGAPEGGRADGELQVKLGPIRGRFAGTVETARATTRDHQGLVRAAGRDDKSGSTARARLIYNADAIGDAETRLSVSVKFILTGALAQFSRSWPHQGRRRPQ